MKNEFLTRIENIIFHTIMQDWPDGAGLFDVECQLMPGLKLSATVNASPWYNEQGDQIRGYFIEFNTLNLLSGDTGNEVDFEAACQMDYLSFYRAIPAEFQSYNVSPAEMFDMGRDRI